jgi:hypothetical protein
MKQENIMAELSNKVIQTNQDIREAEREEDHQRAKELWRSIENSVNKARLMKEPPPLPSFQELHGWRADKCEVFTQALLHARTYANPDWRSMLEREVRQAETELEEMVRRKQQAEDK